MLYYQGHLLQVAECGIWTVINIDKWNKTNQTIAYETVEVAFKMGEYGVDNSKKRYPQQYCDVQDQQTLCRCCARKGIRKQGIIFKKTYVCSIKHTCFNKDDRSPSFLCDPGNVELQGGFLERQGAQFQSVVVDCFVFFLSVHDGIRPNHGCKQSKRVDTVMFFRDAGSVATMDTV